MVGYEPCLQELPEGWPGPDLAGQTEDGQFYRRVHSADVRI